MAVEPAEAEEIRSHLRRHTGWEVVPDDVLKSLTDDATRVDIKRKRSVFRRGEPGPGLFLVKSGELKLSLISSEGREQILYLAGSGKLIGEGFLPREVQCAASGFAMVDSEVWRFDTDHVIRLTSRSEAMAFALMRHMAFRSNRLIDLVLDLSLRSVQRRLASFLFSLAVRSAPATLDSATAASSYATSSASQSPSRSRIAMRRKREEWPCKRCSTPIGTPRSRKISRCATTSLIRASNAWKISPA